jgi:glycerol-3-phosphate dehydrogenase
LSLFDKAIVKGGDARDKTYGHWELGSAGRQRMERAAVLDQIGLTEPWDLVIIGGGATGLGAAVDARARGYRTLLVEAHDFAKGTSSRSTKLVHGGVRYLAEGDIALVREALHERGLLRRNAPHLVHERAFVVPAYTLWARPYYGLGLKLYDLLAGGKNLGGSRLLSRAETLARVPTLEPRNLRGSILYHDGQFDDARLAITLVRTLIDLGGTALNHAPVTALLKQGGRISGVVARDAETGREYPIAARGVINATGVFVDAIRRLDDPDTGVLVTPSQGAHLVIDRAFLPGDAALMIPRTDDGRVLFAIPWHDRTLLGTTDTAVDRPALEPRPLVQEVEFLLRHAARYLTRDPGPEDVLSAFAGLRPLVRPPHATETARISREHTIVVSASGLVTIAGGKWTTYRRMGAEVVAAAAATAGLPERSCATETLRLHGWQSDPAIDSPLSVHGSDRPAVEALCAERPEWDRPLHPRLPYRGGEVVWAARHEQARTVEDVLARRTRALFLDARSSAEAAPGVAGLLAAALGKDDAWQAEQVEGYRELARGYLL